MRRLKHILFLILLANCNNSTIEKISDTSKQVDLNINANKNDSLLPIEIEIDKHNTDSLTNTSITKYSAQNKKDITITYPVRYIEFPSDTHFNGKPMTQQEEISKEILKKHPDTLKKLAIARYKTYDYYFPKSIADNFDEGIATKHIEYPKKLIFRFELFENEYSLKPYLINEIIVRRSSNGELFTE